MNILLSNSLESFFQLLGTLLILVFVLFITWATTRWIAGYQKKYTANKNLKVIDSIRIGNNKSIGIVEAGKKYLVVSIGKDEIHLLTELTKDELTDFSFETEEFKMPQDDFQEILNKMKDKIVKKQD